jgi:hypothetical protein
VIKIHLQTFNSFSENQSLLELQLSLAHLGYYCLINSVTSSGPVVSGISTVSSVLLVLCCHNSTMSLIPGIIIINTVNSMLLIYFITEKRMT